jgi:hypothetical protein
VLYPGVRWLPTRSFPPFTAGFVSNVPTETPETIDELRYGGSQP